MLEVNGTCYVCDVCGTHYYYAIDAANCEEIGYPMVAKLGTFVREGILEIEISGTKVLGHQVTYDVDVMEPDGNRYQSTRFGNDWIERNSGG